ncbi:hypothetical protein [Oscillochloris sp. ZM17-4]|nr:hypothetical protein [Oscillochloris sp. ZM17-4]
MRPNANCRLQIVDCRLPQHHAQSAIYNLQSAIIFGVLCPLPKS